ncbi:MAG: competence protein ComEC [Gaiellaceae bacterium]|nr:competence protein ComEC [Gaiellaceae bacterium]
MRVAPATATALAASAGVVLALVAHAPSLPVVGLLAIGVVWQARSAALLLVVAALAGWWWGSVRVDALGRSVLAPQIGRGGDVLVEIVAPARVGPFQIRAMARVLRFDGLPVDERVLAELPPSSRAPPQGARVEVLGVLVAPRGPRDGFDERSWLAHQGIHVVLRAKRWRVVGARTGFGATGDRLRGWLARGVAGGGEGRAVADGVLLGDDGGLSAGLRDNFRASGLYHVLAASGQNVAIVAGFALGLCWLLGLSRVTGHLVALASIGAYVLAVGAQPSVVRAGVAGALASLAFLAGALRDHWHALALGALVLLAWNPWNLLDAGFELSFAAVLSIFLLAPRIDRRLEGYPLPRATRLLLAVSCACTLATAPVSWLQFHRISLIAVPANLAAAVAVAPLLVLALAAAALAPLSPVGAHVLGLGATLLGSYLAGCARLAAALPGAQVTSNRGLVALVLLAAGGWILHRHRNAVRARPP